ncbi:hypothetical protein GCM10027598_71610 [Amycolatopsis oliviviridis]|uniref:Uncharacterized protein n=1 Tax=Amycolatopsis oliviviridis TaxID=1471590 RepID=A0ABQ3L388_9PSEU|nr:hypothetical protein GCM10017790_01550 [Amycolatopsis oliviviridis]
MTSGIQVPERLKQEDCRCRRTPPSPGGARRRGHPRVRGIQNNDVGSLPLASLQARKRITSLYGGQDPIKVSNGRTHSALFSDVT